MSIESRDFGGVTLTGSDATTFLKQVEDAKPNKAALALMARGRVMAKELIANGVVYIRGETA